MSEALQAAGCVAASATAAAALLTRGRRARAGLLLAALAIAVAMISGQAWDELEPLRSSPARALAAALAASAALGALAWLLRRRPAALPLLLVAALPFRVPIDLGAGEDANLLLPLYLVIGAGAIALAWDGLREGGARRGAEPVLLLVALAAATALYGLQATYSADVPFAARNIGFFIVPFAAMFALLSEVEWSPRLLGLSLALLAGESVAFSLVGVWQHLAEQIFWNPALDRSNDFHFYFRANSLFWDPNIYGRYLALAAVLVLAVVMWTREPRRLALLAATLATLLAGLVVAFSQTSFIAVLVGSAVLIGLRWRAGWTAVLAPLALAAALVAVIALGGTSEAEDEASEVSSGRTTLAEGGWKLFRERPLLGQGSAAFSEAFGELEQVAEGQTTVSHNEPITVAAEQGVVGLLVYAGLLAAAAWTLVSGMRRFAPGLGAAPDAIGEPGAGGPGALALARIAIAGAFAALLVHTIGYGGFLSDPLTWALLAIGGSLAAGHDRARGR